MFLSLQWQNAKKHYLHFQCLYLILVKGNLHLLSQICLAWCVYIGLNAVKWILVKLRKSNLMDKVQIKTKCIPFYRISQTHPDKIIFIIYYIHVRGVTWLAMSDLPDSFENWKLRVTKYFIFFTFYDLIWDFFVCFFFINPFW